ncbi:MAG: hypothetical protein KUL82_03005 [Bdellovibrio sp.]|nr:hypothetical protein [Bdellovibrio sp.]
MMDSKSYDEAIQYFSDLAKKDPHPHVKMAWASAYAARAGVRIEQIYSFVVARSVKSPEPFVASKDIFQQVAAVLLFLEVYSQQWARIPSVGSQERKDLTKALEILKDESNPGARLYGATLRVVLLKSALEEGIKNWKLQKTQKICTGPLRAYFAWGLRALDGVSLLLQDLAIAFPAQAQESQNLQEQILRLKEQMNAVPWPEEDLCI